MRLGIAHHFGWAVAVTARSDYEVVDRRRIELIEPGLPAAPIHHEGGTHAMHGPGPALDDDGLARLVANVRASVTRMASAALAELECAVPEPITVIALRAWPSDFPVDIAVQRRPPYESRADSVMYCEVLAQLASDRGWDLSAYDAKTVEADAAVLLGGRANQVLHGPRTTLGSPWSKDHRVALAATILATCTSSISEHKSLSSDVYKDALSPVVRGQVADSGILAHRPTVKVEEDRESRHRMCPD